MTSNEQLIHHFYSSFQNKDVKSMQACYADNATFSDPVFNNLNAKEVCAMWEMLLKSGKDLRIEFGEISASCNGATAKWDAYYTFSATGHSVVNRISASFVIHQGKITRHQDAFDFHTWARQALGVSGLLLGWTGFLKRKIRMRAKKNLETYMTQNNG